MRFEKLMLTFGSARSITVGCWVIILTLCAQHCSGHGRLIEPPSRASAWRYGFQTPPDYNDHELYCGGFTRQWKRNAGQCGECGDAWDMPQPRPHEHGGQWGQGVIVRSYAPNTEMTIRVELTASHMGYFEFRICPDPNAKQDCLDQHLLEVISGSPALVSLTDLKTRFYPRNGSRIYEIKARLPDMKCDHCVLQWRYKAGNNWGMCDDGIGAVGCGPQEEFRACSDIAITDDAHTPLRPMRPPFRTTPRTKVYIPVTTTESTQANPNSNETNNSVTIILIVVGLLLLLCAVAVWYAYHRHELLAKEWLSSVANRFCQKRNKNNIGAIVNPAKPIMTLSSLFPHKKPINEKINSTVVNSPPVPPPRTKRQTRVKELLMDDSSVA